MAIANDVPRSKNRIALLLTTDFCPWANRFVYWLKEPVGWFALATAISVLIGQYFSPIGWTLAASLATIMAAGMVWPWFAVRVTQCGLRPETDAVHEDTPCRMVLSVRNRIPFPVWGLTIEGYLDCVATDEKKPTVGLASVPPLCTAEYSVDVTPSLRGKYPVSTPQVACSFPFGIWTARREMLEARPLTVWPKVYRILGVLPIIGQIKAEDGDGSRGGRSGEFVGVRDFRRGDSAKHVNWVASARSESLIVTERGGPQSAEMEIVIDTSGDAGRDGLARRIRVAASVLDSLHHSRIRCRVLLGNAWVNYRLNAIGRHQMLDALASVPIDGQSIQPIRHSRTRARIIVTDQDLGGVLIRIENPNAGRRAGGALREILIGANEDLELALADLWKEVRDAGVAA